jgi:hypothetical protein
LAAGLIHAEVLDRVTSYLLRFVQDYNLGSYWLGALDEFRVFITECTYRELSQLNWLLNVQISIY